MSASRTSAIHLLSTTTATTTVFQRHKFSPSQNLNECFNTNDSLKERQNKSSQTLISKATTINSHYEQQVQNNLQQNTENETTTTTQPHTLNVNNNNKKFLLIMFLSICLFGLMLLQFPKTANAAGGTNPRVATRPINKEPGECQSIDIRNECESLFQLTNCTMVRGFVLFVLRPGHEKCDYTNISFPLLREITDFLVMHDVHNLRSTGDLFPNLTVIRGRRLFLNYALGISSMPDLEAVEFRSLIAIQHGHVFISTPKACNLARINWDRITLSVGENHISPPEPDQCTNEVICQGCATEYCWTNETCQRFENDNLIEPSRGIQHCHEECLGGCYNSSDNGCLLCKHLTDHGACVKECPEGKYLIEAYQNCTTESECLALNMTIEGKNCTLQCKSEEIMAHNARDKLACVPCDTPLEDDLLEIETLSDANRIRGCTSLNASIQISLRNEINEDDLAIMLGNLREIRGSLRIFRSSFKSLKFLSGLQRIAAEPSFLEDNLYGIVLYDNENLQELWPANKVEMVHGSMYIHKNKKLCNRKLRQFTRSVVHDRSKDSIQVNDQEVLCDPAKLQMNIQVLSHRSARFSWPKEHISEEVEIMYRVVNFGEDFTEHSELDADICHRIKWTRILLGFQELDYNATTYMYTVEDLKPFTRYACLVKTFGFEEARDARSELMYIETAMDLPAPPTINITKKTDVAVTLQLSNPSADVVRYYMLELYELKDDQAILDRRDFCLQQKFLYNMAEYVDTDADDLDTCCSRKEEERDDARFRKNIHKLYPCDTDHIENCIPDAKDGPLPLKALLRMHVNAQKSNNQAIIRHLNRYSLYAAQVQSCNEAGCGAYAFHALRTAPTANSESLDKLRACRVAGMNEFHVYFSEPKQTSGPITSYVMHFRLHKQSENKSLTHIECMTRVQHKYNNYHFIGQLNAPFNEVAVRVITISGSQLSKWFPVEICPAAKDASGIDLLMDPKPSRISGMLVALFSFFGATFAIVAWSCCRSRCLRGFWRRCLAPFSGWELLHRDEDQQLVEFRNVAEEDLLSTSTS